MNDKLEPVHCGCGGKAIIYINGACQVKIYCEKCGIESNVFATKYEAITAWNRAMGKQVAVVKSFGHPCGIYGYCSNCGGDVYNEDPYCSHCGVKLEWK